MGDVVFIGVTLAFFGGCVAYVRGLDRIVRHAEEPDATHESRAGAGMANRSDGNAAAA